MGNGCGSDGRAVASVTRGPRLESSHYQMFKYAEHVNCQLKKKIEAGNGQFQNTNRKNA